MPLCKYCGMSKKECTCRHIPLIISPTQKYPKGPYHIITTRRAIGLEFEFSEFNNLIDLLEDHRALRRSLNLHQVRDTSVYPSESELTCGPIAGDAITELLPKLLELFEQAEVEVNDTCSLHVHVDARDIFSWGIRSFLLLYSQWEKEFIHLFPPERMTTDNTRHGGYAKPLSKRMKASIERLKDATTTHTIKTLLGYGVYGIHGLHSNLSQSVQRFIRDKSTHYKESRYYACNIHSYLSRGTIELRHHEGAYDEEAILWPLFAAYYVDLTAKPEAWKAFRHLTLKEFIHARLNKVLAAWFDKRQAQFKEAWKAYDKKARTAAAY